MNPRIDFPLLLTAKPYPFLPLIHGPPLLYWLGTSGWCLSLVCGPLLCESITCLLFTRLPLPTSLSSLCYTFCCSFLTICAVDESWVFILCISFLPWFGSCLGMGPSSFNLALISSYFWFVGWLVFLPCHSIASAMLSFDLCLLSLLWACHVLFLYLVHVAQIFAGLILIPSWASLACVIPLGILGPFHSYIPMSFC